MTIASKAGLGTWELGTDEGEAPITASKRSRVVKPKKTKKPAQKAGELAQALLGQMSNDRKTWKALAEETADGSAIPDEGILRRLAPCWDMDPDFAHGYFENDVAAIKRHRQSTWLDKQNKEKLKTLHAEHGTSKDLNKQIESMITEIRNLRLLTRRVSLSESAGHYHSVAAAENQAPRIFKQ